jgi:hypothetical protein
VTKRYDESIEVTPAKEGPEAFRWRGRRYEVDQWLASWREARWADDLENRSNGLSGSSDREFHRVLAHPAGVLATGDINPDGFIHTTSAVYDICFNIGSATWQLVRIWD